MALGLVNYQYTSGAFTSEGGKTTLNTGGK